MDSVIAFDLGGTHLRCASIVRSEVVNLTRERIRSFRDGISSAAIWEEILSNITDYVAQSSSLVGRAAPLVVSFPGPFHEDGRIVNAPTVAGTDEQLPDLRGELSRRTGREVYLLNDVSAACLYLASQCSWDRFMVVTVSSGIGSKVCYRNSAGVHVLDGGPFSGEIGHLTVDHSENVPFCDCGRPGHLGAIASGRGIERLARRRAAADPKAFVASLCHTRFGATLEDINNERHFVPAVRAADRWAIGILREANQPLAQVLAAITFAAGLQGILIIGGFALGIGPRYLDALCELIQRHCDYSALQFSRDMLQFGEMSEEACLRGAAEYATRRRGNEA
jgi:C7-cyclitol 7-kinase